MSSEIKNRVAESSLKTIDLEDFYPSGNRVELDISQFLFEGIILKEKDFRTQVANFSWEIYQDNFVALTNTSGAIIPGWAFMLLTLNLAPFSKLITIGDLSQLETQVFTEIISNLNFSEYKDKLVIIKGCSNKPIPETAYIQLIQKLQPIAKSVMYGEACSSVPLYKRKK
ncbi:MAG: hypothetical protein COB12_03280 [Flavobacterium sp.]|nr:MAG: hypothetical protein COB12_03280 [Flavobacterium sp.]